MLNKKINQPDWARRAAETDEQREVTSPQVSSGFIAELFLKEFGSN